MHITGQSYQYICAAAVVFLLARLMLITFEKAFMKQNHPSTRDGNMPITLDTVCHSCLGGLGKAVHGCCGTG